MIKKIKGSLFAKIFAITFLLTSICCVLTYTVISWLVPKTYSTTLDASLENTVSSFIAELQTMSPLESGTLFDEFLLNNNGVLLQLSDDDGNAIELPSQGQKIFLVFLMEESQLKILIRRRIGQHIATCSLSQDRTLFIH